MCLPEQQRRMQMPCRRKKSERYRVFAKWVSAVIPSVVKVYVQSVQVEKVISVRRLHPHGEKDHHTDKTDCHAGDLFGAGT